MSDNNFKESFPHEPQSSQEVPKDDRVSTLMHTGEYDLESPGGTRIEDFSIGDVTVDSNSQTTDVVKSELIYEPKDNQPVPNEEVSSDANVTNAALIPNQENEEKFASQQYNETNDDHMEISDKQEFEKSDNSGDELFKKKFIKPRTQSFQSVLSTASLKSLGTIPTNSQYRQNSIISNKSSKNFQSFIQAPVLSSVSNLKPENIEIGRQLPFNLVTETETKSENIEDDYSEDTIIQQQKLTMNALKKLSLSPFPKQDSAKTMTSVLNDSDISVAKKSEPYQPAEVDLSSFASLTRQPHPRLTDRSPIKPSKSNTVVDNSPTITSGQKFSPLGPPGQLLNDDVQKYHNEVHQAHLNNLKINHKNQLLTDLNSRRSSPLTTRVTQFPSQPQPQNQHSVNQSQSGTQTVSGNHMAPDDIKAATQDVGSNSIISNGGVKPINKQLQHIKGLRSPMYIPAVLRRTDEDKDLSNESSATLMKSFDSNVSTESLATSPVPVANSFPLPFGLPKKYKNYEHFLRQPPMRKHWIKDETVYKCSHKYCSKEFNFFERRHHCRKCGRIFCKEHVLHFLYINHLAQFTTGGRGTLSRVCDDCIGEYHEFVQHEFNFKESMVTITEGFNVNADKKSFDKKGYDLSKKGFLDNEQVGNVPANWTWSSF